MEQYLGLIAIATAIMALVLYLRIPARWKSDLQQNIWIIDSKDLTTGHHLQNRMEARSLPNQRLKNTFGIDNIFTTNENEWAVTFRKLAIRKLQKAVNMDPESQASKPDWIPLVRDMKLAVEQQLRAEGKSINIARLVQTVTLKVSLGYLFDVPDEVLDSQTDAIMSIAQKINELWIQSKGDGSSQSGVPKWHQQETIVQNLLAVIPDQDPLDPRSNPMNLILPAYETMWRAVFRGLLEVHFRGNHKHADHWKRLLTTYLEDPNKPQNWRNEQQDISTIDVVKEILRLYPPTRRIYRKYPDCEAFLSADLEKMQRDRVLAGDDPEAFRPARWQEIKHAHRASGDSRVILKDFEEALGFLPFAKVCPAGIRVTDAFGWKTIALLVGSLIQGLDGLDGKWVLRAGRKADELPVSGKALASGRDCHLSLVYEKDGSGRSE